MSPPTKGTIFYVGNFKFPDRDAGAHRVRGIGRCLREAGFEVIFMGSETDERMPNVVSGCKNVYDGFSYYSARNIGYTPFQRGRSFFLNYLSGISVLSRLKKFGGPGAAAVIVYQGSVPLLAKIRSFCNRYRIAMIADVTEWYDRRHVQGGRLGPIALDSELRMRYFHKKADGVIAISRFLEDYYLRYDIPTIRIPPLVDISDSIWDTGSTEATDTAAVRFAFVGNAGKKDLLANAVRGLALLKNPPDPFELSIVGPSFHELKDSLGRESGLLTGIRDSLRFMGKLKHHAALRQLAKADFSIMLRPPLRFAHAGFPTKLVESMALGVPVIANLTGDIGMHVRDGIEGILIADESPAAFAEGVRRIYALEKNQRVFMRDNARREAERSFDYPKWVKPLDLFMHKIIVSRRTGVEKRNLAHE
jgi:glycosyltransferase involved in cell wall biosynthesis